MNKQVELTEKLAYRILMFFARHLGFQSFHVHEIENCIWRLEFYNSSSRVEIIKVFKGVGDPIRFGHKPTCKDIVDELFMLASNGERIASVTNNYNTMTLMRPFMTFEELLVKMDLELLYEQ